MPVASPAADAGGGGAEVTLIQVADYGGSYRGSFVPMLTALAHDCRGLGWDVESGFTAVARDRAWLADLEGAGSRISWAPGGYRALTRWLGERLDRCAGAKVVHTHFATFDVPAVVAALRRDDTHVVWHVHSALAGSPLALAKQAVHYGVAGRRASRLVCISEAARASVRRRGASADRATVVENGVDAARFQVVSADERAAARRALGFEATDAVLLHFGWDWAVKGGELFARTLARMRHEGSPAVGLTISEDPRAHAAGGEASGGLRVIAPTDDVRLLYAAADAMLATSPAEGGTPLAMLEALACGTAVVASDIPSHRVAGDAPAALRLAEPNPDALAARTVETLGRDREEREAEGRAAHAWVAAHRGLDAWAGRMLSIYRELLASPSATKLAGAG